MSTKPQIALRLLCFCAAQTLLVLGLAQAFGLFESDEGLPIALALMTAGLLLAMWGVIDPMVPQAGRLFTWAIKGPVFAVCLVCTAVTLVDVVTILYELQWMS